MRTRPKILVIGDGNTPTGFGRVVHSILIRLYQTYEIHHLGINHSGDPHDAPWPIYPAGIYGDLYGVDRVPELVEKIRPELVVGIADPWTLTRYAAALHAYQNHVRTIFYLPIEGTPLDPSVAVGLRYIDRLVVYNHFSAETLNEAFRNAALEDPTLSDRLLDIIPHGVDTSVFYPLGDRVAAKKQLLPDLPEFYDSFIVLNANRNQPRKRIDLTMKGFALFARDKPKNVKLCLHMGLEGYGWNLTILARRLGLEERLILTSNQPEFAWESVEKLNLIYNACDVGINTSTGEGWGLVSFEHGATGAAQVVPHHSSCAELWQGAAELMEPSFSLTTERVLFAGEYVTPETIAQTLEKLYQNHQLRQERSEQAYIRATDPAYNWDNIARSWAGLFEEVLATRLYVAR
ncbi:glycosyltransferase family 4 protein [Anthocerotibacter panamensis]|uniref:glycosyltransferase family 4 protein n=1 Tax=Anthocerotibacter panamensis TaxID=2857077 RepID=UPI001C406DC3|nr:glycosyltransferase [Anthocerotibacter panamensis]